MRRRLSFFFFFLFLSLLFCFWLNPFPEPSLLKRMRDRQSVKIFDRNGVLLREILPREGGRRRPVGLSDVSEELIALLIATEDRRFYYHPGVDPLAVLRATGQCFGEKRVVSGASTITMQLSRMALHRPRTLFGKIMEAGLAVFAEMALSKNQILERYLNHLPFGNELYGIAEASHTYFRKSPKDLSLSEAAYLLAIIRAPSAYNPYKAHETLIVLREAILRRYALKNTAQAQKIEHSLREGVVVYPLERRFKAPHFTDDVMSRLRGGGNSSARGKRNNTVIKTTLDLELNEKIEEIMRTQLAPLAEKNVHQAAVVVLDNKTGEVLGYVGSADYWDERRQGMNDGVRQFRQPGSALKPFTYACALDLGISPAHVLADVPVVYPAAIGDYAPENYDRKYRGPLLMRQALAGSLNMPAVALLREIGVTELYATLKKLGFSRLTEPPDYYGLGLTLGNVEVSLLELARAYLVFGRDEMHERDESRPYSRRAITIIRDFLSDPQARMPVFGGNTPLDFDYPVMIKTGTSQQFRDNWTVAVTPAHTVAVWVGNFNGDSMHSVSGVTGAAPIAHVVVDFLHERTRWLAWPEDVELPKVRVCALSGKAPGPHCRRTRLEFEAGHMVSQPCDMHVRLKIDVRSGLLARDSCPRSVVQQRDFLRLPLQFSGWQQDTLPHTTPPRIYSPLCPVTAVNDTKTDVGTEDGFAILTPRPNAVYKIDPYRPLASQYLSLKTTHPQTPFQVFLDGKKISVKKAAQIQLMPGRHEVRLVASEGGHILDDAVFFVK